MGVDQIQTLETSFTMEKEDEKVLHITELIKMLQSAQEKEEIERDQKNNENQVDQESKENPANQESKDKQGDQKSKENPGDQKSFIETLLTLKEYIDPSVYETKAIENSQTRMNLTVDVIKNFYKNLINAEGVLRSLIYSIIELIIYKAGTEDIQILRTLTATVFKSTPEEQDSILRVNLTNLCNNRIAKLKSKASLTSLRSRDSKLNTQTMPQVLQSNMDQSQSANYDNRDTKPSIPTYTEAYGVENANREF